MSYSYFIENKSLALYIITHGSKMKTMKIDATTLQAEKKN